MPQALQLSCGMDDDFAHEVTPVIQGAPNDSYKPRPPQTDRVREAAAHSDTPH